MTLFAGPHCVSYFKRFKMELELWDAPPAPPLPEGYAFIPWHDGLLSDHAETLFASFAETIDAVVFPSLGDRSGCYFLMTEINRKAGFLPAATWLLTGPSGYCGTVQGCAMRAASAPSRTSASPRPAATAVSAACCWPRRWRGSGGRG